MTCCTRLRARRRSRRRGLAGGRRRSGGLSGRRCAQQLTASPSTRDHARAGETLPPFVQRAPSRPRRRGRRHVHRRLLGLERDQRRVDVDRVAGLHQHVDDSDRLEIPMSGTRTSMTRAHACLRIRLVGVDAELLRAPALSVPLSSAPSSASARSEATRCASRRLRNACAARRAVASGRSRRCRASTKRPGTHWRILSGHARM